jgi:hypothetical protein
MVQDDRNVGEGSGQVSQLRKLRVVHNGIEAEAELPQAGEPLPPFWVQQQPRRHRPSGGDLRAGVPCYGTADTPETVVAGCRVGLEHRRHSGTQVEIGVADDPGASSDRASGALGCDALDELGLSHRPQLDWPFLPVHRPAFDENGLDHPVARPGVPQQFIQQVAVVRAVPKVMVRVADRQAWLDGLLFGQSQP